MNRTKSWSTFFLFQQTTTYDTIWKKRSVATKMKLQQCFLRLHSTPFVTCCCKSACYLDKKCSPFNVFAQDSFRVPQQILITGNTNRCLNMLNVLFQHALPLSRTPDPNIPSVMEISSLFGSLNVHSTGSVAIAGQTHSSSYLYWFLILASWNTDWERRNEEQRQRSEKRK